MTTQLKGQTTMSIPLKRILLADDSPRDTELALDALAQNNLANEVVAVRDGAEALDYLYRRGPFADRAGGNPAVVLLDLKMPKVDGIEVLRQIKSDLQLKMIPVVVLTSSREEQDVVKSYELGVNAYIVKPVQFQEFVEAVKLLGAFWAVVNEPPPGSVGSGRGKTL
jgi:CheY-like chemotaxis protein